MQTRDPAAQLLLFADDTQLQTSVDNLTFAHEAVSAEWARAGLSFNVGKTKAFAPDPDLPMGDWTPSRVSVLKCLGADLTDDGVAWEQPTQGGAPKDELARAAIRITTYAHRFRELEDSGLSIQLAQSLLRFATVGGPQHILMCKLVTPEQAAAFDAAVRGAWQLVLGLEMTDDNWERATYPLKRGGLAMGTVETRASAAYMSALSRTMPEVLRRTGCDGVEALRRGAPALDRSVTDAAADLQARGVPTEKIFADGNGTAPPTQKDIVAAVNDKRYEDRLASLDDDGRGQLRSASGSGSAAFLLMPTQQDHRIEDPLFRVAVVRRLGGRVAPKADQDAQPHCALVAADGTVCGHPLDQGGIHVNQCKKGGHVIRRHDLVVRWLAAWIEDRIGSQVLVEQTAATEGEGEDRLDLTLESGGKRLWLDVAIVNVMTINAGERLRRAKLDGAAARHEEGAKRSRYRGLATPFVIEAHGRPGNFARSVIGRFARDSELGSSTDVALAWQSLSAIVQSGSAALELRSCAYRPADWDYAAYYV